MVFTVKDSGQRKEFDSGMVRDVTEGKIDYSLVFDGPMFKRQAIHLTGGAEKYEPRNWMKAAGPEERDRFRTSAIRHFVQWLDGDKDEDHAAAVFFNINGVEYVEERMEARPKWGDSFRFTPGSIISAATAERLARAQELLIVDDPS